MNGLFHAAQEVQIFMQHRQWNFCFIGGLAVIRWGEARMTQDIDMSLLVGFGSEEAYIQELLGHFASRIPDPFHFALSHRVLLLTTSNGVTVDISLSGLPFEEEMMRRATCYAFAPECSLLTCSAEDLIILKAFADRAKDWGDIEGIVARQGQQLDLRYIFEQLTPLCELKEAPEILGKLQQMTQSIE